jgi:glycosyltransferase involved in cell wall biosynthesis
LIAKQLLKQYKGNYRIITQKNQGVSLARNRGFELAKTDFVALLDADDQYQPDFIKKSKKLLKDFPEGDLYCFAHLVKHEKAGLFYPKFAIEKNFRGYLNDFFLASLKSSIANCSKTIIRKKALQKFGGFPKNVKEGEDLYVWIMLALNGKVVFDSCYVGAIIVKESDQSRNMRVNQIPYPIIYFGNKDLKNILNKSAKTYLWKIVFNSILASKIRFRYQEAFNRLWAAKNIFGFKILKLVPLLLMPSFFYPTLRKIKYRFSRIKQKL